ncbi:HlyD family efflux transporter periplasmic adaptor subunit [Acidaminobacter sp. JC074]|uniref:efflux RND transporter periplasmic adaptor subunit n=1 Tax=Acidaminobacter sp. JC074 TaxID=2530199 RepID=UPI001F0F77EB|nr:HlyD family efflux transporter periplasmic adaptor subunit [Acidaminobacter sp. JC074]MCH4889133.1 HlyD family efflux transporter periplasmic adaptor subunit [Acidaminobacter sp. JC074]
MKKKIIIGLLILALAGGGYFYYQSTNQPVEAATPTTVLAPITTGHIEKTIFSDGLVATKNTNNLYAAYASTFSVINFKEGDIVKEGDVIALLDTSDLEKSLKSAEYSLQNDQKSLNDLLNQSNSTTVANYDKALNAYNQAKKDLDNNQALYDSGIITQEALTNSQTALENAYVSYVTAKENLKNTDNSEAIASLETKIEIDQLEIDNILEDIEAATIYAPVNGTLVTVYDDINKSFNNGELLFAIEDLQNLTVEASVSEYDINSIGLGQTVKIELLGDDKVYDGQVSYIAPKASNEGGEIIVPITIDINEVDQNIKVNFTANIEIVVASKDNAMMVPYESLITTQKGTMLLISRNGEEMTIPVEKGIVSDMFVEIISDEIMEDDQIVINATTAQMTNTNGLRLPGMGGMNGGQRPAGMQKNGN